MIWQRDQMVRRIYLTDKHSQKVKPSWFGKSIGHYENGDTLVIDTIGTIWARASPAISTTTGPRIPRSSMWWSDKAVGRRPQPRSLREGDRPRHVQRAHLYDESLAQGREPAGGDGLRREQRGPLRSGPVPLAGSPQSPISERRLVSVAGAIRDFEKFRRRELWRRRWSPSPADRPHARIAARSTRQSPPGRRASAGGLLDRAQSRQRPCRVAGRSLHPHGNIAGRGGLLFDGRRDRGRNRRQFIDDTGNRRDLIDRSLGGLLDRGRSAGRYPPWRARFDWQAPSLRRQQRQSPCRLRRRELPRSWH